MAGILRSQGCPSGRSIISRRSWCHDIFNRSAAIVGKGIRLKCKILKWSSLNGREALSGQAFEWGRPGVGQALSGAGLEWTMVRKTHADPRGIQVYIYCKPCSQGAPAWFALRVWWDHLRSEHGATDKTLEELSGTHGVKYVGR